MPHILICVIAILVITGIIIRPFRLPEATWAVAGVIALIVLKLLSPSEAWEGAAKGIDVYLFLTGMMLLAETAREEKLFNWLAAHATRMSKGSATRLFLLIYAVGTVVTIFLSNDATAVVLTPAVAAAVKTAKAKQPLPYLLICAFIANAASFVLPISNPANLVVYGSNMPGLLEWVPRYLLPSVFSIVITCAALYYTQRKAMRQRIETDIEVPVLTRGGKMAITGIALTTAALLAFSALDIALGLPTAILGSITASVVLIRSGKKPSVILKGISWSVLPLVAGLFVMVEALGKTGMMERVSSVLHRQAGISVTAAAWESGLATALGTNLVNNLPAALIAGNAIQTAHLHDMVKSAILIGVDLGPNLSVTGSLATILWIVALRREQFMVSAWTFLKLGSFIMTAALLAALAALWL